MITMEKKEKDIIMMQRLKECKEIRDRMMKRMEELADSPERIAFLIGYKAEQKIQEDLK